MRVKYIRGFDGLRCVSIVFVLLTHLGIYDIFIPDNYLSERLMHLISGYTGVNIFFTLSGFLITKILLSSKASAGKVSFFNFYSRRFLRLLPPLIIFYPSIAFLMYAHLISESKVGLLYSIFYIYNFVPNRYYTVELGPTWSLAVEEQFYIFWPFIINYFKKSGILIFAILLIVACLIGSVYLPGLSIRHHGKLYFLDQYSKVVRWFIPAVAPIMAGSVFSLIIFSSKKYFDYLVRRNNFLLLGFFLFFFSPVYLPLGFPDYYFVIQSLGVASLLAWLLFNQGSFLARILEFKPVAYLGKISYGIYIYHSIFITTGSSGNILIQKYPLNLILTLIAAILSYEFIEKRILKYKAKFT